MTVARELMTPDPECVTEDVTLAEAARKLRDLDVGALPIGADDDIREALQVMQNHQVRRLPVIDGHDLVGIISQADIARSLSASATGETVAEISTE